ncbi:MAG: protein kinase, partial [Clostridia bacterium]|nr:protein kinase [Clostridia bacterium]
MNYCIHCMNEIEQDARECPHCGKAQNAEIPAHHLLPGTLLQGRFLIGAALGEGGFGITYIGRDQQLDMRVAVKEYYPNGYATRSNTASPLISIATAGDRKAFFENGKERFLREARVLARFSSEDGIVTVRDFFEANNTAYIVMEYLEGQTLKEYLKKRGRMSAGQALNLMLPVMKSLREVHKQGLIHRDIAPDNIMLVNGKVKLLDFGAARNMSSIANKSLSVMLKPGYAPEEQYRSKGNQGPWTDVYALAATMYKCITGVTPDDSTQRLYSDELKSPSALGVTIAAQFEAAIMKGLAVLQQDRYQSIDEFLEGLEGNDAAETERSADRGPAAADKKAPAGKKRKVIIAAIAAGAAVLVAGIVLLTVLLGGKGKSRNADKTLKLSDNLYDTTFELDGVVYQLPMSFDKLTSDGWSIADSDYSESYKVGGYKSLSFPMRKKGAAINVEVYNTS